MNSKKKGEKAKTPQDLSLAAYARIVELLELNNIDPIPASKILEVVKHYGACKWTDGYESGSKTERQIQEIVKDMSFPNNATYPAKEHTQDAHSQFVVPETNQ